MANFNEWVDGAGNSQQSDWQSEIPVVPAGEWACGCGCAPADSVAIAETINVVGSPGTITSVKDEKAVWSLVLSDGTPENNFRLDRYDDTGVYVSSPMWADRSTGNVYFTSPVLLSADPVQPLEAATKEYVDSKTAPPPSNDLPLMDGTANPGAENAWARGDHIHPTDISRYAASNPAGYVNSAQAAAAAPVQSVAGKTGAVTLVHTDITDWAANVPPAYVLPTASTTILGGVKVDGSTITISGSGVISGAAQGIPEAPTDGNIYGRRGSDHTWQPAAASVTISDTAPSSPKSGDLWWDSTKGQLYVWFVDPNTSQWVVAVNQSMPDLSGYLPLTGGTVTGNLAVNGNTTAKGLLVVGSSTPPSPIQTPGVYLSTGANLYGQGGVNISANATYDGSAWRATAAGVANILTVAPSGPLYFYSDASLTAGATYTPTVRFQVDGTGNGTFNGSVSAGGSLTGTIINSRPIGSNNAVFYLTNNAGVAQANFYWLAANGLVGFQQVVAPYGNVYLDTSGNFNCNNSLNAVNVAVSGVFAANAAGGGVQYRGNGYTIAYLWTGSALQAWVGATNVGNVTLTSDYRIKRDIRPLASMWDKVKALKPISYSHKAYKDFKADDVEHWGFVAHELQETLIEDAATGRKDEGNLIQAVNPMTVIASLTKALQEAMARIEALEAKLA